MRYLLIVLFGTVCFWGAGCGSENPFRRGPEALVDHDDAAIPDGPVSFARDVVPALSSCSSCHRSGAGGWVYAGGGSAYTEAFSQVDLANPINSGLLVKGSGGGGHGGGTLFSRTSTQYLTLLQWIEEGAPDN